MKRIAPCLLLFMMLPVSGMVQPSHAGPQPPPSAVGEVAQKVLPGVVSIQSFRKTSPSVGTGVVLRADGMILTSYHVIENAQKIMVTFFGSSTAYPAKLTAGDAPTDIALLQLQKSPEQPAWPQLTPVRLGDSDKSKTGDTVVAVGNPFGFKHSVTSGIISARGRNGSNIGAMTGIPGENGPEVEDLIQTDAAINPGNSGGPLLNSQGEMIGLNAAIFSQNGAFIGIGFAIPSRTVRDVTEQLLKKGRIIRGWIGVTAQSLDAELSRALHTPGIEGALLSEVRARGPAERHGLKAGDVLTRFDGQSIQDSLHLKTLVSRATVGKKVKVEFLRGGKPDSTELTVQERSVSREEKKEAPQPASAEHPLRSTRELGIALQNVPSDLRELLDLPPREGVLIAQVTPESAASRAGLTTGDVILSLDQATVESAEKLEKAINHALENKKPEPLLLLVQRGPGDRIFLTLPVASPVS